LVVLVVIVAGCSPESKEDYKQAGDAATVAAQKAGKAIAADAKAAAPKVQAAAESAEKSAGQALVTGKVKAALLSDKKIEAGNVTVETVDKVVTLTGTVPSADQHKAAKELASKTAGTDYKIVDKLTVSESSPKQGEKTQK